MDVDTVMAPAYTALDEQSMLELERDGEQSNDTLVGMAKLKRIARHANADLTPFVSDRKYVTDKHGSLRVDSYSNGHWAHEIQ